MDVWFNIWQDDIRSYYSELMYSYVSGFLVMTSAACVQKSDLLHMNFPSFSRML